jgi:ubiquitin carboxyl-terminal hydrolase 7
MIKINEHFEFSEELNLEKYMFKNYNRQTDNKENEQNIDIEDNLYSLHSVVVHKGSPNSGHYYAYIKPTVEDNWIQFNDEIVKPADKYEVFDNNFGGTNKYYKLKPKGDISETNYSFESNAYVLVYVKKSIRKSLLNPIKLENVKIKKLFLRILLNKFAFKYKLFIKNKRFKNKLKLLHLMVSIFT